MVLEARLMGAVATILALMSSGCFAQTSQVTDQAMIDKFSLTLKAVGESCYLDAKQEDGLSSYKLKMKPPCFFVRNESAVLQSFSYKDVNVKHALLIVGSPVSKEKILKWNLKPEQNCGESKQAILIKSSGLQVSDKILEGGVACPNLGANEKDFWYFAH